MANSQLPDDLILPIPETTKEEDLFNTLQDYARNVRQSFTDIEVADEDKVKASSGDATAGYLDAKVDDATIEVSADALQVKDDGITADKINTDVAGDGLTVGGGGALAVNVDDNTIEISADKIQVKNLSILSDDAGGTKIDLEQTPTENKIHIYVDSTTEGFFDSNGLTLKTGASVNEFSTDTTLAGNSDDAVPTEKAVKTYVDSGGTGTSDFFTADGTFTVGAGVTLIWITAVGGGGGGGGAAANGVNYGGGGAGGAWIVNFPISVTPAAELVIQVGDSGAGGAGGSDGTVGQDTIFDTGGDAITAEGGDYGESASHAGGSAGTGLDAPSAPSAGGYTNPGGAGAVGAITPNGGGGGGSPFGGGGAGGATTAHGTAGTANTGAGGGGASNDGTGDAYNGGAGGSGFVLIEW